MSIHTAADIDREFRTAIAHTEASTIEVQIARALFEVGAIDASPKNVAHALGAAARINAGYVSASMVRRNYGAGGITHDMVTEAVVAAA
jgi:hypothetical protein